MTSPIPITFKGQNLGERHRHLNSLVNAYDVKESLETILTISELSPVDRLFKIDLASKHKHVEYILKNLRDDDMLYVSRALKSKWLLNDEYRYIVNPSHLENILYPQMITTAVNKLKHWIHLNLRDPERCQEFYEYYFNKNYDYALKFLSKCSEEMILKELPKKETLSKITPHQLKLFCEKSPSAAKLYFEMLTKDKLLLEKYIANDFEYFNSLKCILKTDAETFMDLTEQHFMLHFKKFNPSTTKFIMTQQKDRFMQKTELYTSRILNVEAIAQCLNEEECEELVLKLARAKYLSDEFWFSYKNVEPLVKKLKVEKRENFKKKVFVDKDVGELVQGWPYALPVSLRSLLKKNKSDIFLDRKESLSDYDFFGPPYPQSMMMACCRTESRNLKAKYLLPKPKTILDELFEEYRFMTFKETLFQLRKKIKAESSSQNRMYMMLVLVSKTGGKQEHLEALFHLLLEHHNEPCQVRAAVIRSLVKRACVWRVTEDTWKKLLVFGQGLGLDGSHPDADCNEGLHAVVIRTLLSNANCDSAIKSAFIKNFSILANYLLTISEKQNIRKPLLNLILESVNAEVNTHMASQILEYAIDTVKAYNLKFEAHPELINTIKNLVEKDEFATRGILKRLFDTKLRRKELFRENFNLIQTDASYMNALKHDVTILSVDTFLKAITVCNEMKGYQFLRKLNVYFNENEDLRSNFLSEVKNAKINKKLARPLAFLIGADLKSYIIELDTKDEETKRFSALIRANAHVARPLLGIDSLEWHKNGAKLIANTVLKCRATDIDRLIKQLLTWKRTARMAIILAQRTDYEARIFEAVAKIRPTAAFKCALTYFRRQGDRSDLRIWEIVKPLVVKVKGSIKANHHLLRNIKKVESVPLSIRPEYATEVYKVISEVEFDQSLTVLCNILHLLPDVDENFVETVLCDFGKNRFTLEKGNQGYFISSKIAPLFLNIVGKYLLLSKTEEIQNKRFETVGKLYLDCLQYIYSKPTERKNFFMLLAAFINSFKYIKAFLNDEYVSCIPVIEKFILWMRGFLPVEKYFNDYVTLHLTMLHYKAIRQIAEKMPEILTDKQMRCSEGYKIFGETFGQYVGKEARVLTKKYFDSIVFCYGVGLNSYICNLQIDSGRVVPYVIKGIVEVTDGIECMIALELFNSNYANFNKDEKDEILKYLNKTNRVEIEFLLAYQPIVRYKPFGVHSY